MEKKKDYGHGPSSSWTEIEWCGTDRHQASLCFFIHWIINAGWYHSHHLQQTYMWRQTSKQKSRQTSKQTGRDRQKCKHRQTGRQNHSSCYFINFETPIFGRTINNHTEENCLTTTKPTKVVSAVGFYQPLPILMHRCTDAPVCIIHYALETGCIIYSLFFPRDLNKIHILHVESTFTFGNIQ